MRPKELNYFEQLETTLEAQLSKVIRDFQNLTEQQLTQTPAGGGWSISECFQHLNTYGDYYLPLLLEATVGAEGQTSGPKHRPSRLGSYLVKMIDPDRSSKKMKALKRHLPDPLLPPHLVLATHLEQQENLLGMLRKLDNMDTRKRTIPTTLSGLLKLNALDVARFLVVHNERHIGQAERVGA